MALLLLLAALAMAVACVADGDGWDSSTRGRMGSRANPFSLEPLIILGLYWGYIRVILGLY